MLTRTTNRSGLSRSRFGAFAFVAVAALTVLSVRLYDLQVLHSAHYRELAEQNRLLRLPVPAERGVIYDRNDLILVRNVPGFVVTVLPADLPAQRQQDVVRRLAELLRAPAEDITTL